MSKTVKYLMNLINIDEDEARCILSDIERERLIDEAESILAFYDLQRITPTLERNKLMKIASQYEDMLFSDSGELEQRAIEHVLGKSVEELQNSNKIYN